MISSVAAPLRPLTRGAPPPSCGSRAAGPATFRSLIVASDPCRRGRVHLPLVHRGLFPCFVRLGRCNRLPRHVRWASALSLRERHEMIDHIAEPAMWIADWVHKILLGW